MTPWLRIFLIGFGLWVATVVVTTVTANSTLIPTLVLLGSFLVPVTFVVWAYARARSADITVELLFNCFVVGGVLGVLGASILETWLLKPSLVIYIGVGLIEEGVKLAALLFVTRQMLTRTTRDGLVLGATVGFGFASFESAGYAFNALFANDGLSLRQLVETEVLRGILAPVGHGLWTAIIGGVLFGAGKRLTGKVITTYLGVSLLHALWDSMHAIAIGLTLVFTGKPWQFSQLRIGRVPRVTEGQVHLYTAIDWGGLLLISVLGLLWLRAIARGPTVRVVEER
ncbi:PrsW family glutamic-type intramembrane protease [Nonomuraea africana]|uniref:RsiW-degrading membrane proteinase PrsW (M82 family) n=1 Tax=Nonomuraea africana TaxID=46171 RepID=A0ABR9KRM9_9ACTN|nr:PrsW family glutamic-type intramembrane protease [Nonomuraea africana]MBE1564685.1 RsiW-degrading membrane proteinase PrsW (M82 family) [Nonomuraea africana]